MADNIVPIRQEYFQKPGHALAAAIILCLADIFAVLSRLHARRRQKQKLMMDDWLMLPALVATVGIGIIIVFGISREAFGVPTMIPPDFQGNPLEITTEQMTTANILQFTFTTLIPVALGCTKASFLCFYMRIFSVNKRSCTNILLVGALGFVALWAATFCLAAVFQCKLSFWAIRGSSMDLHTECPATMILDVAFVSSDLATDLLVAFIPIPLVWRLNLSRGKKVGICTVFLLGGVTIVASLLRLIMIVRIFIVGFDPDEDGILVITGFLYWGMVECGVAVIAACLPTLQFLLRHYSWESITTSVRSLFSTNSYGNLSHGTSNMQMDSLTGAASVDREVGMKGGKEGSKASFRNQTSEDTILRPVISSV